MTAELSAERDHSRTGLKSIHVVLLVIVVAMTNRGVWNADIPLGDEAERIRGAVNFFRQGTVSTNLFSDFYIGIFRYITEDPIPAYYIVRTSVALISVIGLYGLLSSLTSVTATGAFIMSLFWNMSLELSPLVQQGNMQLFAFALAGISGYIWLSPHSNVKYLAIAVIIATILVRSEYVVPLFLFSMYKMITSPVKLAGFKRYVKITLFSCGIMTFMLLFYCMFLNHDNGVYKGVRRIDKTVLSGFQQGYAFLAVRENPKLNIEPFTEYRFVFDEKFTGTTSFITAVLSNPVEAMRYIALNSVHNAKNILEVTEMHSVLAGRFAGNVSIETLNRLHRIEKYSFMLFILCSNFFVLMEKVLTCRRRRKFDVTDDAMVLFCISLTTIIPMMIHVPFLRYYVAVIPLLFWAPAILISRICQCSQRCLLALSLAGSMVMCKPVFALPHDYKGQDKFTVRQLRTLLPYRSEGYTVLGVYPDPLLIFIRIYGWQITNTLKGESLKDLVMSGKHDVVVIDDWLLKSGEFAANKVFYEKLIHNPRQVGHSLIFAGTCRGMPLYLFANNAKRL